MSDGPLRWGYLSGSARIATGPGADNVGPRAHILGFVGALRDDGHDVDLFVLGDLVSPSVSGKGSSRLTGGATAKQLAADLARLAARPVVARRAERHLGSRYDVVYERYALFQELGAHWQRAGVPWVVETNAVLSQEARRERGSLVLQGTASRLERATYRRADLVVAISERLAEQVQQDAGVEPSNVLVLPNAVDVQRFRPQPLPDNPGVVVGYVGFVIARQGLDELLEAVAAVRRQGGHLSAVVVGDGPDLPRLRDLARRLGVADGVRFTGQVPWEEVPAHLATFTVGYSGQRGVAGMQMYHSPLKIYEYLASGRPVVASANPDAVRALDEPAAGWTFPPGDVAALTAVLGKLADTPADELAAAGARGRRHVEEQHTWTHRTRRLVAHLRGRGLVQ